MVSAQIPGTMRIYMQNPAGQKKLVASGSSYWFGPGGSSEGVIANTPEKWNYLPLSKDTGGPGYKIVITYAVGTAATSDASDGAWQIPIVVNGNPEILGNPAHASGLITDSFTTDLTPADVAYVGAVETPIAIFRAKQGVYFKVGGNRVFASWENNA